MTDNEKLIIKKELYKAYMSDELQGLPIEKRYVGAIILGLNRAQEKLNSERKWFLLLSNWKDMY